MDVFAAVRDGIGFGLLTLWRVAYVMIPLYILLQVLRDAGWLTPLARALAPLTRPLRLPGAAAPVLATFLLFGANLGSGLLLVGHDRDGLDRRQVTVLCSFAIICHALVDETAIFAPTGANVWAAVAVRIAVGLGAGLAMARLLPKELSPPPTPPSGRGRAS